MDYAAKDAMLTHNPTEFGAIPLAPQQHPESHRALFRSQPRRSLAYKTSNLLHSSRLQKLTNSGEHQILPYLYDSIRSAKFGCPFARTSIISTSVTGGILLGGCDRKGFL
jgi:hypothetical protein